MNTNRRLIATYVSEQRHRAGRRAKTLKQIALEIGTTSSTVRRWLRRDHWNVWFEHWASADEIWEAYQREGEQRASPPTRDSETPPDIPEEARAKIAERLKSILGNRGREVVDQFVEARK